MSGPQTNNRTDADGAASEELSRLRAGLQQWSCIVRAGESARAGLLVGPDLVLTSYDVVLGLSVSPETAQNARCEFDLWIGPDDKSLRRQTVPLAGDWLVGSSPAASASPGADPASQKLDYAIVRLAEKVGTRPVAATASSILGGPPRGWLPIPENPAMPESGTAIGIWQPATGSAGMWGLVEGLVLRVLDTDQRMQHSVQTESLLPGVPIFDSGGGLVGLQTSTPTVAVPLAAIVRHLRATGRQSLIGIQPQTGPASAEASPPESTAAPAAAENVPAAPALWDRLKAAYSGVLANAGARAAEGRRQARTLFGIEEESTPRAALRGFSAIAVLVVLPAILAWLAQSWLGGAHRILDELLVTAEGAADPATALAWSPAEGGPLFVGTQSGRMIRIERGAAGATDLQPETGTVAGIAVADADNPVPLVIDQRLAGGGNKYMFAGGPFAHVEATDRLLAAIPGTGGPTLLAGERTEISTRALASRSSTVLKQWIVESGTGRATEASQVFGIEDVRAVAALPGTPVVVAGDGSGGIFRIDASQQMSGVDPGQYVTRIGGHDAAITGIAVAAASQGPGAMFVSSAADGSMKAWYSNSSAPGETRAFACCDPIDLTAPGDPWVQSGEPSSGWSALLGMSEDGRYVALLDGERRLAVLDRQAAGTEPRRTSAPLAGDARVAFRPNHAELMVAEPGAGSPSARLYGVDDLDNPVLTFSLAPGARGGAFAFDAGGGLLAYSMSDGTFIKTSLDSDETAWKTALPQPAASMAFSPDGTLVAAGLLSGEIELYRALDGERIASIPPRRGDGGQVPEPQQLAFSADGKRLIAFYSSDRFAVYSVRSLRQINLYDYQIGAARALAGDASQVLFATGSAVYMGSWTGQRMPKVLDIGASSKQGIQAIAADASGRTVAMLLDDGELAFWQREAPNSSLDLHGAEPLPPPTPDADGMKLSADGSALLLRDAGGKLHLAALGRDAATFLVSFVRPFPADVIAADAALGRDGSVAFVALANGDLELVGLDWSTIAADPAVDEAQQVVQSTMARDAEVSAVTVLPGHGAMIDRLAVSPDGALLATASVDGRLRITDVGRAGLVAGLPLAALPAGPSPQPMQAETLFDSPYAFLDETLIAKVQRGLRAAGIGDGPEDGIMGPATEAAIREYQRQNGLAETGRIDRALYLQMKEQGLLARPASAASAE